MNVKICVYIFKILLAVLIIIKMITILYNMSFSRVIDINSNLITIDIGDGQSQRITSVETKLVNVETNESFFFKSIKGDLGTYLDPKYREMTKIQNLYVDNNSYYFKVLSLRMYEIQIDIGNGKKKQIYSDTTELVNIKTNESYFFKSIKGDLGSHLDPKYSEMIKLENLYVKMQSPINSKSTFFDFFGGKRSRKQRNSKKIL